MKSGEMEIIMKIKLGLEKGNMEKIALWCGGELYDFTGDLGCEFEYICTDSREADANTMFVATRGERVDGHDYIVNALNAGCRCILCEYVPTNISGRMAAYVVVENSIDAFADCARGYRSESPLPAVAITGSVGKTTTKELTAAIINRKYNNYCTKGNFNSVIGMPMSLMEADQLAESAVFEMGMSDFGEIERMTRAATPAVAMVTNIGSSHLEYLKTRENIAKAKLEIALGICRGGYLLLNGDEPLLRAHKGRGYETLYVGVESDNKCEIMAKNVRVREDGTLFDLIFKNREYKDLSIPLIGRHFVYNASFAVSAAILMDVGEDDIRAGLASYVPNGMRQNISVKNDVTVIADCYNAAPESMRAAIDTLTSLKTEGKRIAVLGDMKELGKDSDEMHREIGRYLARAGVDALYTLGENGALIAESAIEAGVSTVFAEKQSDGYESLAKEIRAAMQAGDVILFKASRAMALEKLIALLFEE